MEAGMSETSGLYYNLITIVNDDSRVVRMLLQVVASPLVDILMTLEVSFMLLENIYNEGISHMMIVIFL
jgi:hypothetical protein